MRRRLLLLLGAPALAACAMRTLSSPADLTPEEAIERIVELEREIAPDALDGVISADAHGFTHVHRLRGSVGGAASANLGTTVVGTDIWTANRVAYRDLPSFEVWWNPVGSLGLFLGSLGLVGPSICDLRTSGAPPFDLDRIDQHHREKTLGLSFAPIWALGLPGLWWDTDEIEFLEALEYMKSR